MKIKLVSLTAALAIMWAAAPALAQTPDEKKVAAVRKLRKRIQEVAQKLQLVQKAVMTKNPELKDKQRGLRKLIDKKMKKQGINPEQEMAEVMAIQGMLANKDGKMPAEKRKELRAKLRKKGIALQKAHEKAAKDPAVKAAREAFRKEMEGAMIKADPGAKKLLAEFYRLRKQFKELFPQPPKM